MVIECQPPINPDIENQPPFDPSAQQFDPTLPFTLDPTQAVNGPIGTIPIPDITGPDNLKAVFDILEAGNGFKTPDDLFGVVLGDLETGRNGRVSEIDAELVFVDEHWISQGASILSGASGDYLTYVQSEIDRLLLIFGLTPFTVGPVNFQGETDASDLGTVPTGGPNFLYKIGTTGGTNNFGGTWSGDPGGATFAVGDLIVFDGAIWHKTTLLFPPPPPDAPYDNFYDATYFPPYGDEHPDPLPSFDNRPGNVSPAADINIEQRKNQLEFEKDLLDGTTKEIQRTSLDDSFFIVEQTPFFPDQGQLFLGNVQNGLNDLHTQLYNTPPEVGTPVFQPTFYDQRRTVDSFGNFGIGNLLGNANLVLGHAGAHLTNLPNTLGILNARSLFGVQFGESDPCGIFGDVLNSLLGSLFDLLLNLLNQLLAPLFALLAILAAIINELLALLGRINQLLNLGLAQNLLNLNPCALPFMNGLATSQLLNAINLPSRVTIPRLNLPTIRNPFNF